MIRRFAWGMPQFESNVAFLERVPIVESNVRSEIIVVSVLRRAVRPRDRENSEVVFSNAPARRQEHFLPHDLLRHELLRDNCRPGFVDGFRRAGVVGVMVA